MELPLIACVSTADPDPAKQDALAELTNVSKDPTYVIQC